MILQLILIALALQGGAFNSEAANGPPTSQVTPPLRELTAETRRLIHSVDQPAFAGQMAAFMALADQSDWQAIADYLVVRDEISSPQDVWWNLHMLARDIERDGQVFRFPGQFDVDVNAVIGVAQGAFHTPQFVEDFGEDAELFWNSNYHFNSSDPRVVAVLKKFEDTFGEAMDTEAVLAYQAVYVIADALERAGSSAAGTCRGWPSSTASASSRFATGGGHRRNSSPKISGWLTCMIVGRTWSSDPTSM